MPESERPASELGRRLGELRSQQGLTQAELARRLGLTQSAVSRIESGDRKLSAAQLIRAAEILGIDLATLTGTAETAWDAPQAPSAAHAARRSSILAGEDVRGGGAARAQHDDVPRAHTPSAVGSGDLDRIQAPHESAAPAGFGYRGDLLSPAGAISKLASYLSDRAFLSRPDEGTASSVDDGSASPETYPDVSLGRRASVVPALEPQVLADVARDALGLEELGARHGLSPTTCVSWAERRLLGPLSPEPAQAARFWRHELGVGVEGPLPDLVTLLEEAGVYVVHARLDEQVPAGACAEVTAPASVWSTLGATEPSPANASVLPFVFVNGARPVVLQRFALAHEFAHLALGHREAYDVRIDWSGRSGQEVSANAFAEELVAPQAAVRRWLEARGDPEVDVALVVELANRFGVSFWAARYRLRAAGRLPTRRLRELDDGLRRRERELIPRQSFLGGLRDTLSVLTAESRSSASEGVANPLRMAPQGVRVPARMRALALALLERGVISLEQAASFLRFDVPSLREQLARLGL